MGKSENYVLFGNCAAIGLKMRLNIQINELMKLNECQGQGHYLTQISKLNLVFLINY